MGVHDHGREELRAGLHQLDIGPDESASIRGLNYEDTDRIPLHDQWGCEQGFESLFASLGKIFEALVLARMLDGDGFAVFSGEPNQALTHPQLHLVDSTGVETDRRSQRQQIRVCILQIDRTDIGIQSL